MNVKIYHWICKVLLSLVLVSSLLFSAGCNSKKKSAGLFGATGKPLDMVVILPNNYYNDDVKDSIRNIFEKPVMILPQIEPMQSLMFTTQQNFVSMFKTMRNVLYISIDPEKYSRPKITISKDDYAEGQIIIHAKAESLEAFYYLLQQKGEYLSQMIYNEELSRLSKSLETTYASAVTKMVEDSIGGVTINPRVGLEFVTGQKDFVWASDQGGLKKGRSDIIVYSFPYRDRSDVTFSVEYLVHKRDSVMKRNLHGQYPNSYMTTEKIVTPVLKKYKMNDQFRAEMRGLWAMEGDMMGGPFVSHAILDADAKRVIVAEVLVFHPHDTKRNLLLYNEAALYTFRLEGTDFTTHSGQDEDKGNKDLDNE